MSDIAVKAVVEADVNDLLRALDRAAKAGDDFERDMKKSAGGADAGVSKSSGGIVSSLKKIGGAALLYFSASAVAGFAKGVIDAASDLNEAGSAVQAVFGGAYDEVRAFAEGAAARLGQSTLGALEAAKSFGVYGTAAGLADSANAEFSTGLVTLASDLASFHNADPTEVIAAIGSGLRGEAEPLRKYGILLNEAALEQAALKEGIWDGVGALTQEQKILAAHAAIFDQAGVAIGDFEKTQYGLANQQRILGANFTNLKATIGSAFLPVVQAAALMLNTVLMPALAAGATFLNSKIGPAMEGFGERVGPIFASIGPAVSEAFGTVMKVLGPFISAIGSTLGPILSTLGPQVLALVQAFSPLGIILQVLLPLLPMVAQLFKQIATVLGGALSGILPTVTALVSQMVGIFSGTLAQILPVVITIISQLAGVFAYLIPPVMQIVTILAGAFMSVLQAILPLIPMLLGLFSSLIPVLMTLVDAVLSIIMAFLPLLPILTGLITAILPVVVKLFMALLPPILALIQPILGLLVPAIELFAGMAIGAISAVGDIFGWLWNSVISPVANFISSAINLVGFVISALYGKYVKPAIDAVGAVFRHLWTNYVQPVVDFIQGGINKVGSVVAGVFGGLGSVMRGPFEGIVGFIKGVINSIIRVINGALGGINGLISAVNGIPGVNFPTIPKIPMLAKGGTIVGEGLTIVGERGPEMLQLPRGASVIPLSPRVTLNQDTDSSPRDPRDPRDGGDGPGAGSTVNVHFHNPVSRDPVEDARDAGDLLKAALDV